MKKDSSFCFTRRKKESRTDLFTTRKDAASFLWRKLIESEFLEFSGLVTDQLETFAKPAQETTASGEILYEVDWKKVIVEIENLKKQRTNG